jgi:hypothetical protein
MNHAFEMATQLADERARLDFLEVPGVELRRDPEGGEDWEEDREWAIVMWRGVRGLTACGDTLREAIDAARAAEDGGSTP